MKRRTRKKKRDCPEPPGVVRDVQPEGRPKAAALKGPFSGQAWSRAHLRAAPRDRRGWDRPPASPGRHASSLPSCRGGEGGARHAVADGCVGREGRSSSALAAGQRRLGIVLGRPTFSVTATAASESQGPPIRRRACGRLPRGTVGSIPGGTGNEDAARTRKTSAGAHD